MPWACALLTKPTGFRCVNPLDLAAARTERRVIIVLPVARNFFQFAAVVMTPKLRLKISAAVNRVFLGCE